MRMFAAGTGLFLAMTLGACSSNVPDSGDGGGLTTVSMGTQPWIGYGPWYIAKEKGFDKQHGVALNLVVFSTDSDVTSAFASGQINSTNAASASAARLLSSYQDQTIVLFEDISTTADAIIAGPSISTVQDLKGKKVAFEEGTTSDLLLRYALSTAGLTINDIQVVTTPAGSAGAALISGDVDAAVTYEPYVSGAIDAKEGVRRIFTAEEKPGLISDLLTVQTKWAKENPEAVQGLLAAWNDAIEYLRSNPEDGHAIIANAIGAKLEDVTSSFDGVKFYDLAQSNAFLANDFPDLSNEVQRILTEAGDNTAQGLDLSASVNVSYGEQAVGT